MLNQLKNFSADRLDLDEAVALSAFARSFRAECESLQVDVPDWLAPQEKILKREIRERTADGRAARLAAAKARLDALKTPDEKRKALQEEIDHLESTLASV